MVKTRSSSAGQADAEGMPAQTRTPPTSSNAPAPMGPGVGGEVAAEAPHPDTHASAITAPVLPAAPTTSEVPPVNRATFHYQGRTHGPIARWPGSYASADTIHSQHGDFATVREWMAEQRITGPHQGQFIEEEDDLLALSSDDEEEHRVVSYLQLSEIYGIPETDDPREKWAIYCAQCMVAVVERYHRHQRAQPWREAMQLVRILHAYNGSGPSRRIISSLQRAMREGTATPEVFRAGRLLMDTLTEVLAAHRPREQPLLALFVQFREASTRRW